MLLCRWGRDVEGEGSREDTRGRMGQILGLGLVESVVEVDELAATSMRLLGRAVVRVPRQSHVCMASKRMHAQKHHIVNAVTPWTHPSYALHHACVPCRKHTFSILFPLSCMPLDPLNFLFLYKYPREIFTHPSVPALSAPKQNGEDGKTGPDPSSLCIACAQLPSSFSLGDLANQATPPSRPKLRRTATIHCQPQWNTARAQLLPSASCRRLPHHSRLRLLSFKELRFADSNHPRLPRLYARASV
jgi:hypothetical protein